MVAATERAGLKGAWLDALLAPGPRYAGHVLDGRVRWKHPRIVLPELTNWDGRGLPELIRQRLAGYESAGIKTPDYPACGGNSLLRNTACWVTSGNAGAGDKALRQLGDFRLQAPADSGDYGNVWELALAYDLLSLHTGLSPDLRRATEERLAGALGDYLLRLDGDSASLWHGRSSLAAQAWLAAIALTPGDPAHNDLIRRAQAHFLETIRAMRLSEARPEGYNYWINSRGLTLSLAAAAYLNGLEGAAQSDTVRNALERVGLWTVYATRPDHRVVQLGDEGPRRDLKDETRRVIDLIGQLTRNPVFSTYSRYLERVHGRESYYRGYRWWFRLLNDPTVKPLPGIKPGSLAGLKHVLPRTEIFGRGAMGLFIARQGWGPDDTLTTLRAGHTLTHHGHYDAGHFTLYKGAPLAITNATYSGSIAAPNRIYYGIRTVSKNSLLVLRPGERIKPSRLFTMNVVGGGQRIVMPTGSAIRSVDHWLDNPRPRASPARRCHRAGPSRSERIRLRPLGSDARLRQHHLRHAGTGRQGRAGTARVSVFARRGPCGHP